MKRMVLPDCDSQSHRPVKAESQETHHHLRHPTEEEVSEWRALKEAEFSDTGARCRK